MVRALHGVAEMVDRMTSVLLGRDGSVHNIRSQLEDQRRAEEQIDMLARRLVAMHRHDAARAA